MITKVPSTSALMEMSVNCSTSSTMSFCLLTLHTCHIIVSRPGRRSGVDELTDNGSGPLGSLEPKAAERVLKHFRNIYHSRLVPLRMSIEAFCNSSSLTMLQGGEGVRWTHKGLRLRVHDLVYCSAGQQHLGLTQDASDSDGASSRQRAGCSAQVLNPDRAFDLPRPADSPTTLPFELLPEWELFWMAQWIHLL